MSYFARVYQTSDDPWGFETSAYEQQKYQHTLAALPKARYRCVFEPGCAIGVLSELLLTRCDRLIASEPFPRVAERARARLPARPRASVVTAAIPDFWPSEPCDLVVLSEVLYYLTDEGLRAVHDKLEHTAPGTQLIAVHYRGETDYPQTAEAVRAFLCAMPSWRALVQHDEPRFFLDVLERAES
ncbi:MAG: SAM-dependent methyltransferase [Polyangiales bacterium]